jgi:hypothetical protein
MSDYRPLTPCILCGRPPHCSGLFIPHDDIQRQAGTPPDRVRAAAYTLCRRCWKRRSSIAKVEQLFLRDLAAEAHSN